MKVRVTSFDEGEGIREVCDILELNLGTLAPRERTLALLKNEDFLGILDNMMQGNPNETSFITIERDAA
jgi:hypothetical protein